MIWNYNFRVFSLNFCVPCDPHWFGVSSGNVWCGVCDNYYETKLWILPHAQWKVLSVESPVWLSFNKNCRYPFIVRRNLLSFREIWYRMTFFLYCMRDLTLQNSIGGQNKRYMTRTHLFISHATTTVDTVFHNNIVRMPSGCVMFPWFGHTVDSCISSGTENTVTTPNR